MKFAGLISGLMTLIAVTVLTGCSLLEIEGFQDSFEGSRSDIWTDYGGVWTVTGGQLQVGTGPAYRSLASEIELTDFVLQADVISGNDTTASEVGLVFRVTSPGVGAQAYCGYFAGINVKENMLVLGRADGAGWSEIVRATMAFTLLKDTKYPLKVVAEGERIRVYLGDLPYAVLDETDGTWPRGIVGLQSNQAAAKFDNVIATARL